MVNSKTIIFCLIISDILSIALSVFVTNHIFTLYNIFFGGEYVEYHFSEITYALSITAILFYLNRGHYHRRTPYWSQVKYILVVCSMLLIINGFINYSLRIEENRIDSFLHWLILFKSTILLRIIVNNLLRITNKWYIPCIVYGNRSSIEQVLLALNSERNFTGYDIKKVVIFEDSEVPPVTLGNYEVITLNSQEELLKVINNHKEYFSVFCHSDKYDISFEKIQTTLIEEKINYAVVPSVLGTSIYGTFPQYFFGYDVMFLFTRSNYKSFFGRVTKQLFDFIFSLIALIVLSPVLLVIYLFILIESGSPIFAHKRVGLKGKKFKCYKFRTMYLDAEDRLQDYLNDSPEAEREWAKYRKLTNDPRVTKTGRILRSSSLDELPQIINVLLGQMSLVGPRPIVTDELKFYGDIKVNDYLSVKPGITGLWQVSGRSNVSCEQRAIYDSWYVRNWSFWGDIVIICKTFTSVLLKKGAF